MDGTKRFENETERFGDGTKRFENETKRFENGTKRFGDGTLRERFRGVVVRFRVCSDIPELTHANVEVVLILWLYKQHHQHNLSTGT